MPARPPVRQFHAEGFPVQRSMRFTPQELAVIDRTGQPISALVDAALAEYVPRAFSVPWPAVDRPTGFGVRSGSAVSLVRFTAEQGAVLDAVAAGKGAYPNLVRAALGSYIRAHWGMDYPQKDAHRVRTGGQRS